MILLGFYAGARLGDCAGMTWGAVDLDRGTLSFMPAKTERKRKRLEVPLHPRLPAWLVPRLDDMQECMLVREFVQNAPYLSDPEHGEFTRARFLARYEEIMRHRDLWAARDKGPTLEFKVSLFTTATAKHLSLAAEFLRTSREQLMLAILTHAAMTRNPNAAPSWSDMAHLHAAQPEP